MGQITTLYYQQRIPVMSTINLYVPSLNFAFVFIPWNKGRGRH